MINRTLLPPVELGYIGQTPLGIRPLDIPQTWAGILRNSKRSFRAMGVITLSTCLISLNTNHVLPDHVGPATVQVNACFNLTSMTFIYTTTTTVKRQSTIQRPLFIRQSSYDARQPHVTVRQRRNAVVQNESLVVVSAQCDL
jgi:hypothetical protein